jgi:hypothetical protein
LDAAKYTMDDEEDNEEEEDNDNDSSDSETSDEEDLEEQSRPKKKQKKAPRPALKSKSKSKENETQTTEQEAAAERITKAREMENRRQAQIAATRALLQPMVDGFAADKERWRKEDAAVAKVAGKKTAGKRKANDEGGSESPVAKRKSIRLQEAPG